MSGAPALPCHRLHALERTVEALANATAGIDWQSDDRVRLTLEIDAADLDAILASYAAPGGARHG